MSHAPRLATAFSIELPDEASARRAAELLTERGHTVVRVGPRTPGVPYPGSWWRVTGLDEGPYPSDDEHWWMAAEERFIAGAAGDLGGGYACTQADPETARRFLPEGETVADRTAAEVREARLAALCLERARVPAPRILHHLKVPEPDSVLTGGPIPLAGLDDVPWASLTHAYGTAEDVPEMLTRLAAGGEGWSAAMAAYFSAVVHQGTHYESTPPSIGFLVQIAKAPRLPARHRLDLLMGLAHMATDLCHPPLPYEIQTRQEIVRHLPGLLDVWPDVSGPSRAWLVVLAAHVPGTASVRLSEFRAFRRSVEGPSPALDLALAMCADDGDAVLDLTLDAASWHDEVPRELARPGALRDRQMEVLLHLARAEFSPRSEMGESETGEDR
ncbi:hypothetical protein [Actinomadura sp. 9N407]|uniref:hypothetical protein n=1 Tax=Actinomadura sp. 9N407 TaxID=3375154 RepID=UPI0037A52CAB